MVTTFDFSLKRFVVITIPGSSGIDWPIFTRQNTKCLFTTLASGYMYQMRRAAAVDLRHVKSGVDSAIEELFPALYK